MADDNLLRFVFYRTGETVVHNNVKGNLGKLLANSKSYFTVERDISKYVYTPIGRYLLKMECSATKKRNDLPRKQFRIMGHHVRNDRGELANLLIHDDNYPGGLEGCIGPGKTLIRGGVGLTRAAMNELFDACGGFQPKDEAAILDVIPWPPLPFDGPIGTYPTP